MKIFDIVMMLILIATNLIVVISCWLVYRKNFRYRDGMLLGVHIPFQHANDPELTEFCRKKEKTWNIFNKINIVAGCIICLPALYDWGLCVLLWCIWLVVYLVLMYYYVFKPHREMYRIKKERGWFDETTKHKVMVDTRVSAASGRMAPSWRWHIPIALILALTGLVSYKKTDGFTDGGIEFIMLIVSAAMCMMFAGFHITIANHRNKVYSENTELNYAANRIHKRSWAWSCLWANIFSTGSSIFVIIRSIQNSGYTDRSFIVYCVLVTFSAILMVYLVMSGEKKIRKMLEADTEAVYIDDDEYWKWGFYNNPSDSRIMIQSKWASTNYTMNLGHPVGKAIMIVTALILVATIVFTIWTFVALGDTETFFTVENDTVTFDAFMYEYTVDPSDIENIQLLDQMPDEHFSRVNGAATGKVSIGNYKGSETGKCKLFLTKGETPILMIKTDDMTVFANSTDEGAVEEWYDIITDMM